MLVAERFQVGFLPLAASFLLRVQSPCCRLTYEQAVAAGNTIEMTYYAQRNGTEKVDANNSFTRVRSFTIHVRAGDQNNPVRSISVTGIPTHEERDDVPTGEVWTYKNTIHIQGVSGEASDTDTYRSY